MRSAELVHTYRPRGTAVQVMEAREDEVLVCGPAGTGKSRVCLEKLHLVALLNPGMRGLIVRKTSVSLGSTTLVTWREQVIKEALATGTVHFYGGSPQEAASYRYDNGSVIVVGGMDKATKIMSSEYDLVFADEATELTLNDWEAITSRLRHGRLSFQQLLAACNPDAPTHWLKQRCDKGMTRLINSRHEDNPVYYNSDGTLTERGRDYIGKLDRLTGVRHARLRLGLWAAAEGMVYDQFQEAVHVVDPFSIPEHWPRYLSVDFGFTNPFVAQWWAEDEDGRLYLYREIYRTRRTVDQHARDILDQVTTPDGRWLEPRPAAVVCDHDAEGRAVLERELGVETTPAHKRVLDGIQAVQARLRVAEDGKPRLFFVRGALVERDPELEGARRPTCTVEEIPGYIWSRSRDGREKDQPVKADDHGMDAMRYMVAHRDLAEQREVIAVAGFNW